MVFNKLLLSKKHALYFCVLCFSLLRKSSGFGVLSIHRRIHGDSFVLREDDGAQKSTERDKNFNNCNCTIGTNLAPSAAQECSCQCNQTAEIFREDLLSCVQEINECPLDSFEMIPQAHFHQKTHFISTQNDIPHLDLNHPKDEGKISLFCIIVKGQYLTRQGWEDMEGTAFDLPLRLRSDQGNLTFEWVGNSSSKETLEGRLILIHLLCKNAASSESTSFQQCVPFRVEGHRNLTEAIYLLQEETNTENSLTKGILIAIGLLLASLTISYILISFFYFRVKRKRNRKRNDVFKRLPELERGNLGMSKNYYGNKNIQNDFKSENPRKKTMAPSPPINSANNEDKMHISRTPGGSETEEEEDDEIYSTASYEEELEGRRQRYERLKKEMEATQLRQCDDDKDLDDYDHYEATASSLGLAIVETSGSTEHTNSSKDDNQISEDKPVVGMRPRKRLFFNPSYFDPEMLQSPPPAAVEFLSNVRHMMAVAKQKIQMKSFQPTLIDIPEDYGSAKGNKSNLSTLESNSLSNLESRKEFNFNSKINEMASYSNEKDVNKIFLNQRNDDKNIINVVDNLFKNKDISDQNLVNGIVRNFEIKSKPNNVCNTAEEVPFPSKNEALRLKVKMLQRSPKINNETRTNRSEFKSTSIKRHRSLKENTQAFKNSVEAIKQEIQSKLTRVSSLSRVQSLKKNKKEILSERSMDSSDQHVETRKNKVQRWLHSIECGNTEIPANFFVNSNIKDKLLSNDPNISAKESNCQKKATINSINFKGPVKENQSLSAGYTQSEESNPYQQDTEIYTINIDTHFLAKDDFCNNSNINGGNSSTDNEYLLPKNSYVQNALRGEASNFNSTKLLNSDDHNIIDVLNPLEDHSYEEIQYNVDPSNNDQESNYYQSSAFDDDSIKYEKINEDLCSNIVSECVNSGIQISGDNIMIKPKANNFLCIELSDSLIGENSSKSQYSLEKDRKNRKPVKRNDSIVQDSLERPKVKKKIACDKSEKDYSDIFSLRGIKAFNLHDSSSDGNSYKTDKPLAAVRRSKTMKTFKDYKKIRFCSSKLSENKLTFFGEAINLNYKNGKTENSKNSKECPPPLPPKHLKTLPENQNETDTLYPLHSTNISLGSQSRPRVRYSNSFTPIDFSRRPKQIFHIYGDIENSNPNYCLRKKQEKNSDDILSHTDTLTNTYDQLDIPQSPTCDNNENNVHSLSNQKIHNPLPKQYTEFNSSANNSNTTSIRNSYSISDNDDQSNDQSAEPIPNFDAGNLTFEENTREELERYLSNKNDVTNVKQNWKNFLNKIEVLQGDQNDANFNDHLKFFQNNTSNSDLRNKVNENRNLVNNEPTKPNLKKSNSISLQNFVKKNSATLVHRSVSLHRMAQGGHGNNTLSLPDTENPKFSVYINDSFDIED